MKDKDPNEDEFNQDEQDNINEADDSFGLPDLDFTALDDEPEEASTEEPQEEPVEEPDEISEETVEEEETPEEETQDDAVTDEMPEEPTSESSSDSDDTEIEVQEEETPTYEAPKQPSSIASRIMLAIFAVILIAVGAWYFAIYRPAQQEAEQARLEQVEAEKRKAEAEAKKKQEEARLLAEKAANEKADADEAAAMKASFATISSPTGRYYVVVASFIDQDMAKDMGERLKADGVSSVLLSPDGKRKFNRLTLGDYGSFNEAQDKANKLKGEFGDGLWVLKY